MLAILIVFESSKTQFPIVLDISLLILKGFLSKFNHILNDNKRKKDKVTNI